MFLPRLLSLESVPARSRQPLTVPGWLRACRFSSEVLLSSLQQLFWKYRGQAPPLWKAESPDNPIHQLVRRTIEDEIVDVARVPCVDVWYNLLAMCEHQWRTESDVLLGVIGTCLASMLSLDASADAMLDSARVREY